MPQKVIHFSSKDFSCPHWFVKRNTPVGLWHKLTGRLQLFANRLWLVFYNMEPKNLILLSMYPHEGFLLLLQIQILFLSFTAV